MNITNAPPTSQKTFGPNSEGGGGTSYPVITGGVVRTAETAGLIANDVARMTMTQEAALVTFPFSVPEVQWNYAAAAGGILNTTTAVTIKAAAAAGISNYLTAIQIASEALTTATEFVIRDGVGGTVLFRIKIPTTGLPLTSIHFNCPLTSTAATLLEVATLTASGAGAVYFNAQGFTGA